MFCIIASLQSVRETLLISYAYKLCVILQSAIMPSVRATFQNVRNALLISDAYKVQEDLLKMFYVEIKKGFLRQHKKCCVMVNSQCYRKKEVKKSLHLELVL
jgi:hypothetical protein